MGVYTNCVGTMEGQALQNYSTPNTATSFSNSAKDASKATSSRNKTCPKCNESTQASSTDGNVGQPNSFGLNLLKQNRASEQEILQDFQKKAEQEASSTGDSIPVFDEASIAKYALPQALGSYTNNISTPNSEKGSGKLAGDNKAKLISTLERSDVAKIKEYIREQKSDPTLLRGEDANASEYNYKADDLKFAVFNPDDESGMGPDAINAQNKKIALVKAQAAIEEGDFAKALSFISTGDIVKATGKSLGKITPEKVQINLAQYAATSPFLKMGVEQYDKMDPQLVANRLAELDLISPDMFDASGLPIPREEFIKLVQRNARTKLDEMQPFIELVRTDGKNGEPEAFKNRINNFGYEVDIKPEDLAKPIKEYPALQGLGIPEGMAMSEVINYAASDVDHNQAVQAGFKPPKKKKRGFFKKLLGVVGIAAAFIPGLQPLAIGISAYNSVQALKNGDILGAVAGFAGSALGLNASNAFLSASTVKTLSTVRTVASGLNAIKNKDIAGLANIATNAGFTGGLSQNAIKNVALGVSAANAIKNRDASGLFNAAANAGLTGDLSPEATKNIALGLQAANAVKNRDAAGLFGAASRAGLTGDLSPEATRNISYGLQAANAVKNRDINGLYNVAAQAGYTGDLSPTAVKNLAVGLRVANAAKKGDYLDAAKELYKAGAFDSIVDQFKDDKPSERSGRRTQNNNGFIQTAENARSGIDKIIQPIRDFKNSEEFAQFRENIATTRNIIDIAKAAESGNTRQLQALVEATIAQRANEKKA